MRRQRVILAVEGARGGASSKPKRRPDALVAPLQKGLSMTTVRHTTNGQAPRKKGSIAYIVEVVHSITRAAGCPSQQNVSTLGRKRKFISPLTLYAKGCSKNFCSCVLTNTFMWSYEPTLRELQGERYQLGQLSLH